MEENKRVEEFLNFFLKNNENPLKVTYERSCLKQPVWFIKYASKTLYSQPAILKVLIKDNNFIIDDYRVSLTYDNFKDFKKSFVEVINSDNMLVKMRILKKMCKKK
jgi:hypothetical protein